MIKKLILILMFTVMGYTGFNSSAHAGTAIPLKVISLTSIGGAFFSPDGWEIGTVNSNSVQYECVNSDNCYFEVSNRSFNDDFDYSCPRGSVVAISQNAIHIPKGCSED